MIIETYTSGFVNSAVKKIEEKNKKEGFGATEEETAEILCITAYVLWIILWVMTIISAINVANLNYKNSGVGLIISVLAWPFYWVFRIANVIGT